MTTRIRATNATTVNDRNQASLGQPKESPLRWSNVPATARELVLIVEDIDVPFLSPLVHAITYELGANDGHLVPGAIPKLWPDNAAQTPHARLGLGAGLAPGWMPVTPIPGHGPTATCSKCSHSIAPSNLSRRRRRSACCWTPWRDTSSHAARPSDLPKPNDLRP